MVGQFEFAHPSNDPNLKGEANLKNKKNAPLHSQVMQKIRAKSHQQINTY